MVSIGQKVPPLKILTFMQGALALFDFAHYRGRWLVLCCIQSFGLIEAACLDHEADAFTQGGAKLLVLTRHNAAVHSSWFTQVPSLQIPLLVDPLSRIQRALDISFALADHRCCTVLIDPNGILRFRLVHALHAHGMDALKEILVFLQDQASQKAQEFSSTI